MSLMSLRENQSLYNSPHYWHDVASPLLSTTLTLAHPVPAPLASLMSGTYQTCPHFRPLHWLVPHSGTLLPLKCRGLTASATPGLCSDVIFSHLLKIPTALPIPTLSPCDILWHTITFSFYVLGVGFGGFFWFGFIFLFGFFPPGKMKAL